MRKFLTKAKIKLCILIFAFVGIITIAGNISLSVNKGVIDKGIAGLFNHDITVGPCFYVFPNTIIFKEAVITKTEPSPGGDSFRLSRVAVRFEFWRFLTAGKLRISHATLYPSKVNYDALNQFLEDNFLNIVEIVKNVPSHNMMIRVKEALLDFGRESRSDYITTEFLLSLQGDSFEGTGLLRKGRRPTQGEPLLYKFQGQFRLDGLNIDHLILKSASRYSKLWGSVHGGTMKMNGFVFMDMTYQSTAGEGAVHTRSIKNFSADSELANIDVYILDIDGQMNFAYPTIAIERLEFAVNNIPVTLKGNISLLAPFGMDIDLLIHPPVSSGGEEAVFKKTDAHLAGQWRDNALHFDGVMTVDFHEHDDLSFWPETARFTFKDLAYYPDLSNHGTIKLARGDMAYWTNDNQHQISIEDFKATANTQIEGLKVITFDAPFYDGSLEGKMWYDSSQIPARITSQVELRDVDTDAMEELLVHFVKFNGRMSGVMNFTNAPQPDLSGNIVVSEGQITDFNFFNWVSDSFRLPSLKTIDFDRASAQFSINKEIMQLYDIRLKTGDVRIGGYFNIDNQNLVTSKLSIALSKKLLSDSSKFKPILILFEEDHTNLDFDFRLSGNLDMMNFQWLPSPVKRKIQTRIPDFIERRIERNIDELMEADAQNGK